MAQSDVGSARRREVMSDDRIAKATLAAGIFQAVFPTVTTDRRQHDIAIDETVKLTESIYKKLFPLFDTPGANSGKALRDSDPYE
jgi:hypothetical protein